MRKSCDDVKNIYILLTKTPSIPSRIVGLFTGAVYTHSSIAFDNAPSVFYSFSRLNEHFPIPGGLVEESLNTGFLGSHKESHCKLICLEVTDKIAEEAQRRVMCMMKNRTLFRYSLLGCVACSLGIAHKRRRYYFCSQFVGEILEKSGAVCLSKSASLLIPDDFMLIPHIKSLFCGTAGELSEILMTKNYAFS